MRGLGGGDRRDDRIDLVRRVIGIAADVERDERRAPIGRDLVGVRAVERARDVRGHAGPLDATDDVKASLRVVSVRLCRSTLSCAGWRKLWSRILAMRPDSPGAASSLSCFV